MSQFSFENRVSLTRKSVDLVNIIEDLSSDYNHRDDFMRKHPDHLFKEAHQLTTSEICSIPVCAGAVLVVLVGGLYAGVAVVGAVWFVLCESTYFEGSCYANTNDMITYLNVV